MKRSNRVILLLGILLAVTAFGGVVVLTNQQRAVPPTAPTQLPTVYARVDVPIGTVLKADMVEARPLEVAVRPTDAYGDVGAVVGKTVRTNVVAGAQIRPEMFGSTAGGPVGVAALLDPGMRAMAVGVNEDTGIGSLIAIGDRVDLIIGITGDKFPLVTTAPVTQELSAVPGINPTSTKVVIQSIRVLGTVAPAVPTPSTAAGPVPAATGPASDVILEVTPQQAEVIRWAQIDGSFTLILRSPKDYLDANGTPAVPVTDATSGVVLRTLIDKFGVLPPQVIPATGLPGQ